MTMVGLPLILFQVVGPGVDMGDLEFLSIKEFDSKLRQDDGTLTAIGDLATLTANTGKDMYLGKAKIVMQRIINPGASFHTATVALKLNGITVEQGVITTTTGASNTSGLLSMEYEFISIGQRVTAGQIIKLEVTAITSADSSISGTLVCFEETTDDTPQIPSI